MRNRPAALALPLLLAPLAACGTAAASQPQPPDQATLNERAVAARDLGRRDYAGSYAGEAIDTANGRVILYRVPSAAYDRALQKIPSIHPVDVRYSEATLLRWRDQLVADLDTWEKRGITLNRVGPSPADNCLTVGVDDPDRDGPTITAQYQGLSLCLVKDAGRLDLAGG